MSDEHFLVKTNKFEGPLELLLEFIEKRKLHISDIALAKVADDFMGHMKTAAFSIHHAAHFLLVASTLLLIKSKSLLPILLLSKEEEGDIEELKYRLKVFKYFKHLSNHISNRFGKEIIFSRHGAIRGEPVFTPGDTLTIDSLRVASSGVINALPKKEIVPKKTVRKVVSLEEMITELTLRIQSSIKMNFSEFSGGSKKSKVGSEERIKVIVGFLAMLELVKQGVINVIQDTHFGKINMESTNIGVPKYD